MKESLLQILRFRCAGCVQRLRALSDKYFTVKLLHAWVLGFIALGYVGAVAPLALQSLVLVAAKVWAGILMGHAAGKALYGEEANPLPYKTYVVCVVVLAMALGV